jgi:hypothetical protein
VVQQIVLFLLFVGMLLAPVEGRSESKQREARRGHYFVVVWGYQGPGNMPKDSHTFASFYDGDDLAEDPMKVATISWMPDSGFIHLLRIERGRNFSLAQTLAVACQARKQLKSWGPYEITPDLYRRALARIKLLDSGKVSFSALPRRPDTMNCFKAAGDITNTSFRPGMVWGFRASEAVVRHFSPFFKGEAQIGEGVARLVIGTRCQGKEASLREVSVVGVRTRAGLQQCVCYASGS